VSDAFLMSLPVTDSFLMLAPVISVAATAPPLAATMSAATATAIDGDGTNRWMGRILASLGGIDPAILVIASDE
jgi:hypothetical protein